MKLGLRVIKNLEGTLIKKYTMQNLFLTGFEFSNETRKILRLHEFRGSVTYAGIFLQCNQHFAKLYSLNYRM